MSDLKVDFKTKVLEWKRKFNGLVDKVAEQDILQNENIPVFELDENNELSEEDLEKVIKLSCFYLKFINSESITKDLFILTEIYEYESGLTYYFVSQNFYNDGIEAGNIKVFIVYNSVDEGISQEIYAYNIYDVLNTKQSKLYKHFINDADTGYSFTFISPIETPIDFDTVNSIVKLRNKMKVMEAFNFKETETYYDACFIKDSAENLILAVKNALIASTDYLFANYLDYSDIQFAECTDTVVGL